MILEKIEVRHFRNIENAVLEPSEILTVISGQNGQGKTNLLESIWLLSGAKSFRGAKDAEFIQKGFDIAHIEAEIRHEEKQSLLQINIGGPEAPKQGRYAKVNGVDYGRASSIAGIFYTVCFAPTHLSLIKGAPEGRRRFIDAALCQLYPGYLDILRRYTRLITQKNALLKDLRKNGSLYEMLEVFNRDIAKYGMEIIKRRQAYVLEIEAETVQNYKNISHGTEQIEIAYQASAQTSEELLQKICDAQQIDIKAGFCTQGPHRDDLYIGINDSEAKVYASQGQQRSAVLSLKMAEAAQIKKVAGQQPVMLLDDVLSELDSQRQDYLLNKIEDSQVLVTSCDSDLFVKTKGKIYVMEKGKLTAQS
ncbi:MAG: DNA replication/repair protein RecF [Oscillospiraceae bacterium]|nr:DNA replication/repair protein RecF [Oscillospiraceae bacterium]